MKTNPTIKAMSLKQLAACYSVNQKTFKSWLTIHNFKIGTRKGYYFSPSQVKTIFEILGEP